MIKADRTKVMAKLLPGSWKPVKHIIAMTTHLIMANNRGPRSISYLKEASVP